MALAAGCVGLVASMHPVSASVQMGSAVLTGAVHDCGVAGVMHVGAGRRSGPSAMSATGGIAMSMPASGLSPLEQPDTASASSATKAAPRPLLTIQRPGAEVPFGCHHEVALDRDRPAHARHVVAGSAAGGDQRLAGLTVDGTQLRAVHVPDDGVGAGVV